MKRVSALWAILLLGAASACSGSKHAQAKYDGGGSGGAAGGAAGGSGGAAGGAAGGSGGTGEQAAGGSSGAGGQAGSGGTVGGVGGGGGASADYTSWTDCGQDGGNNPTAAKCICDAVNQCTANLGWVFVGLGSTRYRVCGYHDGQCVIAAFSEVEGGANGNRCLIPLGSNPCTNGRMLQSQIGTYCTPTYSCNVMLGNCPADPIACPP